VLGLDSGFAASGYAVVELADPLVPIALGVIRTAASAKKLKVKAADDNMRRGREITKLINPTIRSNIVAICMEAPSLPRNASTSFKLGIYYGIIASLSEMHDVPVVQVTPQALKKGVCGKATASKDEIARALDLRFSRNFADELVQRGIPAGMHEHAYDALGTIVASEDSEVLRLARRMGR
jgi:Holliday junction resolvasome RuvABC endonuclease subunit